MVSHKYIINVIGFIFSCLLFPRIFIGKDTFVCPTLHDSVSIFGWASNNLAPEIGSVCFARKLRTPYLVRVINVRSLLVGVPFKENLEGKANRISRFSYANCLQHTRIFTLHQT